MQELQAFCRLAVAAMLIFWASAVNSQSIMEPGGWEMRVRITAQEPGTNLAKTLDESTMKQCLSAEFLKNDPYLSAGINKEKMLQKGATCSLSDQVRNGNSASWRMICNMADGTTVDMSIKNSASRHELSSDMRQLVTKGGRTVPVRMAMNAKFLGKCTPDMLQPQ
jgi:hypothetical protein